VKISIFAVLEIWPIHFAFTWWLLNQSRVLRSLSVCLLFCLQDHSWTRLRISTIHSRHGTGCPSRAD